MFKDFIKHPVTAILGSFLATVLVAQAAVGIVGFFIMGSANCPEYPGNPCDGAAMAAGALFIVAIPFSMLLGILASVIATYLVSRCDRDLQ